MIDVSTIIAGVQEYARPNRYRIELFPPNTMINGGEPEESFVDSVISDAGDFLSGEQGYGDQRSIAMNCSAIALPGISYATKEIRNGSGPLTKIPYDKIYEPVTATFYTDVEYDGRRFFIDWINQINKPIGSGDKDTDTNHFGFYTDYIGGMYIYQLDAIQLPSHLVELREVYPTAVSEITLGYENADSIATYTVTFSYKTWTYKPINRQLARALAAGRDLTDFF